VTHAFGSIAGKHATNEPKTSVICGVTAHGGIGVVRAYGYAEDENETMKTMQARGRAKQWAAGLGLGLSAWVSACQGQIGSTLLPKADETSDVGAGGGMPSTASGFDPSTSGAGGGFEQCQGIENEATKIPVSMFIQVDKSGSMNDNGKWSNTKAAFKAFFNDPEAQQGLNVALRFWPDAGCDPFTCNMDQCAKPQVELGPLSDPNQVQALVSLFNSKSPNGPTPMSAALAGATKWAVNQQTMGEGKEKVVVVLVTDGEPNGCDNNINNIAAIAESAYQKKEILTFAVGLQGSQEFQMNTIAKGGHTDKGFFIGNGNAQADLLAALKKIQNSVVACTYAMPESPDPNQTIDASQVNVNYDAGDGSKAETIYQVDDASKCGATDTTWYYDDPQNPSAILLCPGTCDKIQANEKAKIKVVLGCATQAN